MKRKRPRLPDGVALKDVAPMFERTIVAICRESRMQRRIHASRYRPHYLRNHDGRFRGDTRRVLRLP